MHGLDIVQGEAKLPENPLASNGCASSSLAGATIMNLQSLPQEYQDRIKRFDYFFVENTGHTFQEDDLFNYEMFCMQQSLVFYEHFKDVENIDEYIKDFKQKYEAENDGESPGIYEIVKNIPGFDQGHSGNTLGASWLMFITYKTKPEMVKFLHGSLANLVGDSGYYDNREDVKQYIEEHGI